MEWLFLSDKPTCDIFTQSPTLHSVPSINPRLSLKYTGYCSVFFFNRSQILAYHGAGAALCSTCKSTCLPACNHRRRRGLQSFPRLSQGEYKGRSVCSPPASPAPSLWTGRSCQQLPAPSHHTALHVPTGSDRLGADRSTQHSGLTHTHTRLYTHKQKWLCPVCLQETLIQACAEHKSCGRNVGHCLCFYINCTAHTRLEHQCISDPLKHKSPYHSHIPVANCPP